MSELCESCYPEAVDYGEISPSYRLMYYEDKFHIINAPYHKDDYIVYTFNTKPYKDPDPECELEDDGWFDNVFEPLERFKLSLREGYCFTKSMEKAGWDGKGMYSWIVNRCDELITAKSATGT